MNSYSSTRTAPFHFAGASASWTRWLIATAAVLGGGAIVAGAILPWLSFFAGLFPQRGIIGLNGRLLLAGGVVTALSGIWFFFRADRRVRLAIGALGAMLLAFASYLLVRLLAMHRELVATQPMLVPEVGTGLYLCLAGALLVTATLFFGRGAERS